jgi:hypothetical protein
MVRYILFEGNSDNYDDFDIMAIEGNLINEPDFSPLTFFRPKHQKEVKQMGIIDIDGDHHLLPRYFSVK